MRIFNKAQGKVILFIFFSPLVVWSQQALLPAGGNAANASGSVSYSVGQVFYNANSSSGGSVHEGVQHAFEWYPVSIKKTDHESLLSVYPNPTSGQVYFQYNNKDVTLWTYEIRILDATGNFIKHYKSDSALGQLDLNWLTPGWYTLQVYSAENIIQSYKILKI